MRDFLEERKVNKRKVAILIFISILIIFFIVISIVYVNNRNTREWIDKNIFRKEKMQNNLPSIEIDEGENFNIYAFNRYIGLLNKNNFTIYNNIGKEEEKLALEITSPIFSSNNKYLSIAENKGKKMYLIVDKEIAWEKDVEGNIAQISINKNGYVAVTIIDTSYKTVVEMYNNEGELLFKTFLKSTRVVSTSISNDNKYLAIAEIDTSGTVVQSNIKIISIEEGKSNAENSIKKIYNGENGDLITNIKYQDKNKLICMYTNKIVCIKDEDTKENLQEYGNKKISFASIELSNYSITVEEKSSGIFTADSVVNIINSENKSTALFTAEAVTKDISTCNNVIALNLGAQVEFINTNGWLLKRYLAEHEITNIVLSDSIAGIIYRDKIEIINL